MARLLFPAKVWRKWGSRTMRTARARSSFTLAFTFFPRKKQPRFASRSERTSRLKAEKRLILGGSRNPSLRKTGNALEAEAKRHNVSVVQLALAWLLQKSPVILPIPGTSSLAHLVENMAATKLQLTQEDWKRIEDLARKT